MLFLLLAISCSALISIIMRLSTEKTKNNIAVLAANYLTCFLISAAYTASDGVLPQDPQLPRALVLGIIQGVLFLLSFVLLQRSIKRNGVVLSSVFMKLGLLVPLVMSVVLFNERPTVLQILGFAISATAIVLINHRKSDAGTAAGFGLLILLLSGGATDAMSKIYEELGPANLSSQFLLYTFAVAFLLCVGLLLLKKQAVGKQELLFGFLIGVPNYFSAKFLLQALQSIPAVIAYPTYSVATLLLITLAGILLFKERLSRSQWIAVIMILVALLLLNL